jgi:structural maintenance of chromosomes protein 6
LVVQICVLLKEKHLTLFSSGGERSYTTMCLLVALGETLETPFRIMDEFDVFLDVHCKYSSAYSLYFTNFVLTISALNAKYFSTHYPARKLTIKALIHVAKRMNHRQFIFITPQDLSSIQPDPQLQILKLLPPQRHSSAGGLTQQTLEFQDV